MLPHRPRAIRPGRTKAAAPQAAGASPLPARPALVARRRRQLMKAAPMRPPYPPGPRQPAVASPRPARPRAMPPHRPPLAPPPRLRHPPRLARLPRLGQGVRRLAPKQDASRILVRSNRRPARAHPFPEHPPRMARRIGRRPCRPRGDGGSLAPFRRQQVRRPAGGEQAAQPLRGKPETPLGRRHGGGAQALRPD